MATKGKPKPETDIAPHAAEVGKLMAQDAPDGPVLKRLQGGLASITRNAPTPHLIGVLTVDGVPVSVQYEAVVDDGQNLSDIIADWRKPKFQEGLIPFVEAGHRVEFFVSILGKSQDPIAGTYFLQAEVGGRFWGPLKKKAEPKADVPPKPEAKKNGNGNGSKKPPAKPVASKKPNNVPDASKTPVKKVATKTARKPSAKPNTASAKSTASAKTAAKPVARKATAKAR
jgi:hypothetical protein